MHSAPSHIDNRDTRFARFGFNHGYRLEGDSALLNAQIDVSPSAQGTSSSFALQLWACAEPYQGGPLSGFKIAEAPIALSDLGSAAQLDAVAFARPPAAISTRESRDYSMVLVLAAGSEGAFDQVYDFANYPARQRFMAPHLSGAAGYKLYEDGSVSLHVDGVVNPRSAENLSGTLSLQLWACDKPYDGGELNGTLLASHELGQLCGQESRAPGELRSALSRPVAGGSHVVLALCEWTALGYLARDYGNFVEPHRAQPSQPAPAPATVSSAPSAAPAPSVVASVAPAASTASAPSTAVRASVAPAASVVPQPVVAVTESAAARPSAAPAARPSLNAISEDELVRIAGISKKLAGQVIKARPFKSFEGLLAIRGVGDKIVDRLRKQLTL
jgi:DNA uptake protein ComE-like DNA-binding protein